MRELTLVEEPALAFGDGQKAIYPRDGLSLFGPFSTCTSSTLRLGYVGTQEGLKRVQSFLRRLSDPVRFQGPGRFRVPFPGFEALYGSKLPGEIAVRRLVSPNDIERTLSIREGHQRVHATVSLFSEPLEEARRSEDNVVDLWLVHVPDAVYRHGRVKSGPYRKDEVYAPVTLSAKQLKKYESEPSLFDEDNVSVETLQYKEDFRTQLKFRLLSSQIAVQLLRDTTIDRVLSLDSSSEDSVYTHVNDIAWNLSTTLFYKNGGLPWKLAGLRDGVCYLGLVFKRTYNKDKASPFACCAAQMFLDSGEGVVFKGAVGPWYSEVLREFHLSFPAARDLVSKAIASYKNTYGSPPKEMFIHGKANFSDDEWKGFLDGLPPETTLAGVRIRDAATLRLYTHGDNVALRGLALVHDERHAVLVSNGWIPRLQTYPGREVPIPLAIDLLRGDADMNTVLSDVLSLTKLNYNTCLYGDGRPVTLRFAESIGSILTSGPQADLPPLPFKYYI